MNTNKLYRKYKTAIVPSLAIIVLSILTFVVINFFWQRISLTRDKIAVSQSQKNVLDDRYVTLQGSVLEAKESSNLVSFALPESSPAISILSHLNRLSVKYEVVLDGLSISKGAFSEDTSINSLSVNFDITGGYNSIYGFISDLSQIAPITNLSSLEMENDQDGNLLARVQLVGFYAPFPTELPPLTEALEDFTDEEKGTLNFIGQFEKPVFAENIEDLSNIDAGKENPFEEIN